MKIYILDRDPDYCDCVREYFGMEADVEVVAADFEDFMNEHIVECVVSPANAYGLMDGGYDLAITRYFGDELQLRVQQHIVEHLYGEQPVGTSFIVEAGEDGQWLIHTPTMRTPEEIRDPRVIYHCMRSTLICAYENEVESIVIPLFGCGCGGVDPSLAGRMMWRAYKQMQNPPSFLNWQYARSQEI